MNVRNISKSACPNEKIIGQSTPQPSIQTNLRVDLGSNGLVGVLSKLVYKMQTGLRLVVGRI